MISRNYTTMVTELTLELPKREVVLKIVFKAFNNKIISVECTIHRIHWLPCELYPILDQNPDLSKPGQSV